MGVSVERAVQGLEEAGADVVGSNCGTGIDDMVAIAREIVRFARIPVGAQPNAGFPATRGGAVVYGETPGALASRVAELLDLGVRLVGGAAGRHPSTSGPCATPWTPGAGDAGPRRCGVIRRGGGQGPPIRTRLRSDSGKRGHFMGMRIVWEPPLVPEERKKIQWESIIRFQAGDALEGVDLSLRYDESRLRWRLAADAGEPPPPHVAAFRTRIVDALRAAGKPVE
jgi:hypothetical protein